MSDATSNCKRCGRPLPAGVSGRCEACVADRRAKIGKAIATVGTVVSVLATVAIRIIRRR